MALRRKRTPDAIRARVARRAQGMATHDLHEWAEQCTASLDAHVLNLRKSDAILNGEGHDAIEITAVLAEVLTQLVGRYSPQRSRIV